MSFSSGGEGEVGMSVGGPVGWQPLTGIVVGYVGVKTACILM